MTIISAQSTGPACICFCVICESVWSAHDLAILFSYCLIILFFCPTCGLLSIFLEWLLRVTVFSFISNNKIFAGINCMVFVCFKSVVIMQCLAASTYDLAVSIAGIGFANLLWIVSEWLLFLWCCGWFWGFLLDVTLTCCLFLAISHPVFITCTLYDQSLWLWVLFFYNTSMGLQCPIISPNHYSTPQWNRIIISENIIVLVSLFLSFHKCLLVVMIVICINGWPVNDWHNASHRALE